MPVLKNIDKNTICTAKVPDGELHEGHIINFNKHDGTTNQDSLQQNNYKDLVMVDLCNITLQIYSINPQLKESK